MKSINNLPSFDYIIDSETGERIYQDPDVQRVYVNLGRLSEFINRSQVKSDLEYTYICQNVSTSGDTNTNLTFLCNLLVGAFEFMGDVEFPWVGKAGGKIAGWLLSALVDTWRSEPPESLQNDFNNVWNGTKQAFDEAQLTVDTWRNQLDASVWTKEYTCPKTKEVVTVSQLADVGYLPDPQGDPEFDLGAIAISKQTDYAMCSILVPSKWRYENDGEDTWWNCYYTRWNDQYPYDGPFYDGLTAQYLFGVYTSFPDLDVVENTEKIYHYKYFSTSDDERYDHNWFSNDRLYKGTKYTRWNMINKDDGGTAPDSFIGFLFKDGPGGNPDSGIALRDDVFNNWGMK